MITRMLCTFIAMTMLLCVWRASGIPSSDFTEMLVLFLAGNMIREEVEKP